MRGKAADIIEERLEKIRAEIMQIPDEILKTIDPEDVDDMLDLDIFRIGFEDVVKTAIMQIDDSINNYKYNGIVQKHKYFRFNHE
jgi:hypothetical protein